MRVAEPPCRPLCSARAIARASVRCQGGQKQRLLERARGGCRRATLLHVLLGELADSRSRCAARSCCGANSSWHSVGALEASPG
jgi:hypothetical protein